MAEFKYEYEVVNGPSTLNLAHALLSGSYINFTVRQKFGEHIQECWVVTVDSVSVGNDDLREAEVYHLTGILISTGKDLNSQSISNVSNPEHGWSVATSYELPHYNSRQRRCPDAICKVFT